MLVNPFDDLKQKEIRSKTFKLEKINLPLYVKYNNMKWLNAIGIFFIWMSITFLYGENLLYCLIGYIFMVLSITLWWFDTTIKLKRLDKFTFITLISASIAGLLASIDVFLFEAIGVNKYVCGSFCVIVYFILSEKT